MSWKEEQRLSLHVLVFGTLEVSRLVVSVCMLCQIFVRFLLHVTPDLATNKYGYNLQYHES